LENHKDIYIGSWVLLGFSVLLKIFIKVYFTWNQKTNYFIHRFKTHYMRMIDSFLEHVILLTGLWILVLQSRTEGGNSPLLFVVNIILLFIISFYFIMSLLDIGAMILIRSRPYDKNNYVMGEDDNIVKVPINPEALPEFKKEAFAFFSLSCLAFAYQAVVTLNFFARPFFIKDLNLSDSINIPLLILLFFFTMLISLVYSMLLIHYSEVKAKTKNQQK
jgi:hypothetical protein